MDINKCNIYFGNLKIKTGYFGQYKFYDDNVEKLTLLKFDDAIYNGVYVAPKYTNIIETKSLNQIKLGEAIVNNTYVSPKFTNIIETKSLNQIKFSEV